MRLAVAVVLVAPAIAVAEPAQPPGDVLPPTPQQVATPPQQIACDACVRGSALLDSMGSYGNTLRMHAKYVVRILVDVRIENGVMNGAQQERISQLVTSYGGELLEPLRKLDGKSDQELADIGAALCSSPDEECARLVGAGLAQARSLAHITDPPEQPEPYGLPVGHGNPGTCDPYVARVKSPKIGFGAEYATGWQDSAKPTDGRAWSIGIEARTRITNKLGLVARVDRSTGRDESIDADDDGHDDVQAGTIARWMMMVGGSLRLTTRRMRDMASYWQVDSLVGLSRDASRSGPIAALDLSYQYMVLRLGVRAMQGFGDAGEESAILVHSGIMFGAGPQYDYGAGCGNEPSFGGSAWAIGFDVPLSGATLTGDYIAPGFGLEGAYHGSKHLDALIRGDLLVMPQGERERSLHQALLVGLRADVSRGKGTGFFGTIGAGYDVVATTSSDPIQSGPVVEGSIAWGAQASDGGAWLRLHGRFGVGDDNRELRAIFMSLQTEFRLDRSRWRDRN